MQEHEKRTSSDVPKIDFNTPGLLPESVMGYGEQRKLIEAAIGDALTTAFQENAEFVTQDTDGRNVLKLRVPLHDKTAPVTVSYQINAEGIRSAHLTFGAGWENNWTYEDGPNQTGRLIPCTRDPETGDFIPKPSPEIDDDYDPTSDYEVAFWGKPWVKNLRNGSPEIPKPPSRLRTFGRSILRRTKH